METDNFEDIVEDGSVIKWTLNNRNEGGVDWSGSENGQVAGSYEHWHETSGFIKCGEFLD